MVRRTISQQQALFFFIYPSTLSILIYWSIKESKETTRIRKICCVLPVLKLQAFYDTFYDRGSHIDRHSKLDPRQTKNLVSICETRSPPNVARLFPKFHTKHGSAKTTTYRLLDTDRENEGCCR